MALDIWFSTGINRLWIRSVVELFNEYHWYYISNKIFQPQEKLRDPKMKTKQVLPFFITKHVIYESLLSSFYLCCRNLSRKFFLDCIWKPTIYWCWPFEVIIGFPGSWNGWWIWCSDCASWRWCFHGRISWRVHWRNTHQFSFLKSVKISKIFSVNGYNKENHPYQVYSLVEIAGKWSLSKLKSAWVAPLTMDLFAHRTCQREKAKVRVGLY